MGLRRIACSPVTGLSGIVGRAGPSGVWTWSVGGQRAAVRRTAGQSVQNVAVPPGIVDMAWDGETPVWMDETGEIGVIREGGRTDVEHSIGPPEVPVRLWVDAGWVLRASRVNGETSWSAGRVGGPEQVIARGQGGLCGETLSDGRAYALDSSGHDVVVLALDGSGEQGRARDIPLDRAYCVSARGEVIAVTGVLDGHPAVAMYEEGGGWQTVALPGNVSVAEASIAGERVLVRIPEQERRIEPDRVVRAAGAIYMLERLDGRWLATAQMGAPVPAVGGLFGFSVASHDHQVWVSYFDGREEPAVCVGDLTDPWTIRHPSTNERPVGNSPEKARERSAPPPRPLRGAERAH